MAQMLTNIVYFPSVTMDLHIPNALLLVTYLMKLSIGVPPRWIVQAITLVVKATGDIVHHHVIKKVLL